MKNPNGGIYIHIPFCISRCSYCDFATEVYRSEDAIEQYVSVLLTEIEASSENRLLDKFVQSQDYLFDTIYFGGGTPSLLNPELIERIIEKLRSQFTFTKDVEFTIEMNPATVSVTKLCKFKDLGVNRASFGLQTFDDRALKLLARGHNAQDARDTFSMLREAGFANISFDLIGGLPSQSLENWTLNLDQALNLNPEHLSLYLLEIHEGTPLANQINSNRQTMPDPELAAGMYETMIEKVLPAGFVQYEISNFAKPGYESRHNSKYWLFEPVVGFGVSAHSFDGEFTRWANERRSEDYEAKVNARGSAIAEINNLSPIQLSAEFAFLRLRMSQGLSFSEFKQRFCYDLFEKYESELNELVELELIEISDDLLTLTRKGIVFSNEVFAIFV